MSGYVSLGWSAISWIEHYLVHGPGDVQGQPVELDLTTEEPLPCCLAVSTAWMVGKNSRISAARSGWRAA